MEDDDLQSGCNVARSAGLEGGELNMEEAVGDNTTTGAEDVSRRESFSGIRRAPAKASRWRGLQGEMMSRGSVSGLAYRIPAPGRQASAQFPRHLCSIVATSSFITFRVSTVP
jgi:hypothetical protein